MHSFQQLMVDEAINAVEHGYKPPQKPACAYFVSEIMKRAGWNFHSGPIGWVPTLANLAPKTDNPKPGDLVIFHKTYDAVKPKGIGAEDDFTHIGILLDTEQGVWRFAHYSAGQDRPVISCLTGYWTEHIQEYRRITTPKTESKPTNILKIFYHPKAPHPKFIINQKEEQIAELHLTALTTKGTTISLTSHPFQKCPALHLNDTFHPVKSIGKKGVEYV